jgi:hypothetical protein
VLDSDLRAARLRSLLLATPRPATPGPTTPAGVVEWLGAMQAQDLASAMWSLGVRLPGSTEADITGAIERGEVLRTWPMRGTIHLVPPADADWMLSLTAVRALQGSVRRREQLGLSPADTDRAAALLEAALAGGRRLTRGQCLAMLDEAGIGTAGQRGYYLLWYAAQVGVTCIGPQQGTEQTFVLLHDWAPRQARLSREDALVELAHRYFRSHGPTTVRDFAGWTGLTLTDARAGVAGNDGRLVPVGTGADQRWASPDAVSGPEDDGSVVLALPGFDEFILGYKDRTLHVPDGTMDRIVPGGNGMFRSTIVVDGAVQATWRRTLRARGVDIVVEPFAPVRPRARAAYAQALESYAAYLGREATIRFDEP